MVAAVFELPGRVGALRTLPPAELTRPQNTTVPNNGETQLWGFLLTHSQAMTELSPISF